MKFEDAVDIMQSWTTPTTKEDLTISTNDGKKQVVKAEVRDRLALYRHNREWHLVHTLTGISIHRAETYEECWLLMSKILERQIDLCFTLRDIKVFRAILQVIGTRKEFVLQLPAEPLV